MSTHTDQLERSLASVRQTYPPSHRIVTNMMDQLGMKYFAEHKYIRAVQLFEESLDIKCKKHHKDYASIASTLYSIAAVRVAQKDYISSIFWLQECLRTQLTYGDDHVAISNTMHALGKIYMHEGKTELALENCLQALHTRKLVVAEDDLSNISIICSIGRVYCSLDHSDNAMECFKRVRNILARHVGSGTTCQLAEALIFMGYISKRKGVYDGALMKYKEAENLLKSVHGDLSISMNSIAAMITDIQLLVSFRLSYVQKIKAYITSRSKEKRYGILSFTKEQKIQAARCLLNYVATCDIDNLTPDILLSKMFLKHKAALSNGRLLKLLQSLRLDRSRSSRKKIVHELPNISICM